MSVDASALPVLRPPLPKEPLPSDPDWTGWDSWREWKHRDDMELREKMAKRFSEAELAAEHWRELFGLALYPSDPQYSTDAAATFLRFASSPHYFMTDDRPATTEEARHD